MSEGNTLYAVPGLSVTMFYDAETGEVNLAKRIGDESQVIGSLGSLKELASKVKYFGFNNKIQAIRFVKSTTGWGLRESMDYMDSL